MRRVVWALVLLAVTAQSSWAVDKDKAKFMGGTSTTIKPKTDGEVDLEDPTHMIFTSENASLKIPWGKIQTIEYGQSVSRRWRMFIFITPFGLFSKTRKHMVTITYQDHGGADQAAVFEFGKDVYRVALATLKAKSRREISCQDEEARKQFGRGCTLAPPTPEERER